MVLSKLFEQGAIELNLLDEGGAKQKPLFATPLPRKKAVCIEEELYSGIVFALQQQVYASGCRQVVVGVSGGVDSALVLCLAVDALGACAVRPVFLPSRYTSKKSHQLASALVKNVGLPHTVLPIDEFHSLVAHQYRDLFAGRVAGVVMENVQARIRGLLLSGIANQHAAMVLATGNKSEAAMGYATLYGDTCGGFAPIGDVTKHWVYRLCVWRNQSKRVIPAGIINRPPTAELRRNQKDSDSLLDYERLDPLIEALLEPGAKIETIAARHKEEVAVVAGVYATIRKMQFKRAQMACAPKVSRRSFGSDVRLPIS